MIRLYALLCVAGAALPLAFLGAFLADEGLDPAAAWDQISASDLSLMAWADVLVAALAVIAYSARQRVHGLELWWLPVVATLAVGPSLGLPLLLLLRARRA